MIPLRLPGNVKQVFVQRLTAALPLSADRVIARTREMRGGRLNDPRFGSRMQGQGPYIEGVRRLFETLARRHGLETSGRRSAATPPSTLERTVRAPRVEPGQLRLPFGPSER